MGPGHRAPTALTPPTWVLSSGSFARDADVVRVPPTAFASDAFVARALHAKIVSHVTRGGTDLAVVERLLQQRYGVRAYLFCEAESPKLISMLEDMPPGLQNTAALKTIIRRATGAPVTGSVTGAYLEIGPTAFTIDRSHVQYDLVREKARFVVTPEMQAAWGEDDLAEAIEDYVLRPETMMAEARAMRRASPSTSGRSRR